MSTTNYVKQFKQTIMDRFREMNANIGHVLPQAWLTTYFPESIKQKVVFEQAIQQLQDENLIEYQKKLVRSGSPARVYFCDVPFAYRSANQEEKPDEPKSRLLVGIIPVLHLCLWCRWFMGWFGALGQFA